ncbi:hypothetical protein HDU76_001277 [Blyttiomyces sp. JEL0837]|nr:hypothetical protein HDU76_001277 [Blyttiomyces sp. JEL0837]
MHFNFNCIASAFIVSTIGIDIVQGVAVPQYVPAQYNNAALKGMHLVQKADSINEPKRYSAYHPIEKRQTQNFTWFGGPIISNIEVNPIFYGKVNYQSELEDFYQNIVNSTYWDLLSQYNTSTQSLGRGTFGKSYIENRPSTRNKLDDIKNIQDYLMKLVTKGKITPNVNSYYPIHFQPGYTITKGNYQSCSYFCAYHGSIDITTLGKGVQYLYYGVIPDQGGSCAGGCGKALTLFENLCSVTSHELAESATDPAVGNALDMSYPLGWYDANSGEVGDICNGEQDFIIGLNGANYTIQKLWSNKDVACVI